MLSVVLALIAASPGLGQTVLYVDANATGRVHDGSSWCSAYTALQDGLAGARASDGLTTEIRVADGVYKPDQGANQVPGDREASFQLINGVAVRGGYAGCGAPDPDERNITLHEAILSGDLSGDDGAHFANNEENSYHVFFHPEGLDLDDTAALDGFTIMGANSNGHYQNDCGGGIYNFGSSPTVTDCTFKANFTSHDGGGMWNRFGSPTVTKCTFTGNSSERGGGMFNWASSLTVADCAFIANLGTGMYNWSSSPTVSRCTFSGNAGWSGGGMYNGSGSLTVTSCTFVRNLAICGGGMHSYSSNASVMNCTFSGNSARSHGGAMYHDSGRLTVKNCTLSGNWAGHYGGGIYNRFYTTLAVANCILWKDIPSEIYITESSSLSVSFTCIERGYSGEGNIHADPLLVDPGYWDDNGTPNEPTDDFWVDGDYHLQAGSPCIDAGDNVALPLSVLTDLDGNPRFVNDPLVLDMGNPGEQGPPIVDMGAYERQVVLLDILPRRCPNRTNVKSRRPVPMAIVGTDTFDVMQIDPDSLVLTRADGVGGSVRPVLRKPGRGITIKDVATPFDGDLCDCHKRHGDGIDDLLAMFSMGEMADVLELDSVGKGESVILTISGMLSDGSPFEASDCILITGRR